VTSPRRTATPVSDWLASQPVVDLALYRDVLWAEQGLKSDAAAAIAWLEEHGEKLTDRLIDEV
jgi:hypothetical protein